MPRVDWTFLNDYSPEEIVSLCGLPFETLEEIYLKHCGKSTPIRKPIYLWYVFVYYKIYPITRAFRTIHHGVYKDHRYFMRLIYKWQVSTKNRF